MGIETDDLIDVLARALPGVTEQSPTYRSETTMADAFGTTVRRLHDLRRAGLLAPSRLGRGWVYGPAEAHRAAVLAGLLRLGATVEELVGLFTAPDGRHDDGPARRAERFLEALSARVEEELARLHTLEELLHDHAAEVARDDGEARYRTPRPAAIETPPLPKPEPRSMEPRRPVAVDVRLISGAR